MRRFGTVALGTLLVLLFPAIASAHPGHPGHGFAGGFAHPFTGADHVLAMFAVGMWTAQLVRAARWQVAVGFVGMMTLGGMFALAGAQLPSIESAILASVLVIGLFVFFQLQLNAPAAALMGLFALLHGYAHVIDMPAGASAASYVGGFVFASAALIAAGMAAARLLTGSLRRPQWLRACGGAIAVAALALLGFA